MGEYKCLCCGYMTLDSRAEYDICPVCFWEDDAYLAISNDSITSLYYADKLPTEGILLDVPSGANHGLTLRKARENYLAFGACEKEMLSHVREPRKSEKY